MSLPEWHRNGWLVEHRTSPREIADILAAADRDLADSRTASLSADWRFHIGFNAAYQAANAALAAAGYRASRAMHHYLVIRSLALTVEADKRTVDLFEAFRRKRNIGTYERPGTISDQEAGAMHRLAVRIRGQVEDWLRQTRPALLER